MECYACGRDMRCAGFAVRTSDGQHQEVGKDCYQHVKRGAENGWQPRRGGPRLYTLWAFEVREAWETENHQRAQVFGGS